MASLTSVNSSLGPSLTMTENGHCWTPSRCDECPVHSPFRVRAHSHNNFNGSMNPNNSAVLSHQVKSTKRLMQNVFGLFVILPILIICCSTNVIMQYDVFIPIFLEETSSKNYPFVVDLAAPVWCVVYSIFTISYKYL